ASPPGPCAQIRSQLEPRAGRCSAAEPQVPTLFRGKGAKTKENVVQSVTSVAEKTKEQANAVSEAVVTSVNTVAIKTVEEAENIAITSGVIRKEDLEQPAPSQEDKAAKAEEEVAEEAKSGGD
uniref:Gamma-synuclein n=1 Tax=Felis catus TaxID=9685 RepID=A0ABI7WN53_FELCA